IRNQNIGNQEARGFDFGLYYQRPTPWGTFTSQTQATYLDEFIFQGFIFREFGSDNGNLAGRTTDTGTLNEGWYKWKGTSSLEWTWNGFDLYTIVRYIDGFHEFTPNIHQHWVHQTFFFDGQLSYDFTALLPVEEQPVPGYSKGSKEVVRGKDGVPLEKASAQTSNYSRSILDHLLRGTIITIGSNTTFAGVNSFVVRTLISSSATTLIAASMFAGTVLADPTDNQAPKRKQKVEERTVFVTGSLIPQRVKLQPIGTTTLSPVRIIDRHEIDRTGRQTTPGALINDPSVRIIGH